MRELVWGGGDRPLLTALREIVLNRRAPRCPMRPDASLTKTLELLHNPAKNTTLKQIYDVDLYCDQTDFFYDLSTGKSVFYHHIHFPGVRIV